MGVILLLLHEHCFSEFELVVRATLVPRTKRDAVELTSPFGTETHLRRQSV